MKYLISVEYRLTCEQGSLASNISLRRCKKNRYLVNSSRKLEGSGVKYFTCRWKSIGMD